MVAQNGALVFVKIGDGADPEAFTIIGGLRLSRISLNNQLISATNRETGAWRQLLAGSGIRSLTIGGNGLFTESASEELLRAHAFSGGSYNYQFVFASGDSVTGPFQIASYERGGNHESEEHYSIVLESAGELSYQST